MSDPYRVPGEKEPFYPPYVSPKQRLVKAYAWWDSKHMFDTSDAGFPTKWLLIKGTLWAYLLFSVIIPIAYLILKATWLFWKDRGVFQ